MKVLFVTKSLDQKKADGGLAVTLRNYKMLQHCFGENNVDLLEFTQPGFKRKLINLLFRQSYGQTKEINIKFLNLLKTCNYDYVFFNSSLYGNFVKKCNSKNINTIVFFHNVECNYYFDMWKEKKSILYHMFYNYVKNIENQSCKYSTYRIALNERDNKELFKNYNYNADLLIPISMPKKEKKELVGIEKTERYCMFLGSDFYANQHGVSWFIENVAPYINMEFRVAGSICNSMKAKYKGAKNTVFVGYVDNLEEWYKKSSLVVSPIFLGSGMKTKTVEALSYGKSIIGTDEAFVGIDADFEKIGGKFNTAQEFISSINSFRGNIFNDYAYEWFNENLSEESIFEKYKAFIFDKNR